MGEIDIIHVVYLAWQRRNPTQTVLGVSWEFSFHLHWWLPVTLGHQHFVFHSPGSFTSVVCVMLVITFLPEYVRLYVAAVSSASIVTTPPLHLLKKWENTQSLCDSAHSSMTTRILVQECLLFHYPATKQSPSPVWSMSLFKLYCLITSLYITCSLPENRYLTSWMKELKCC